jgi:hypothetical protein
VPARPLQRNEPVRVRVPPGLQVDATPAPLQSLAGQAASNIQQ